MGIDEVQRHVDLVKRNQEHDGWEELAAEKEGHKCATATELKARNAVPSQAREDHRDKGRCNNNDE